MAPASYAEPSISKKLRRGDVLFPAARTAETLPEAAPTAGAPEARTEGPAARTRSKTGPATNLRATARALCTAALLANCCVSARQLAGRKFPSQCIEAMANAVLDKETGKMMEYRQLLRKPETKKAWSHSSANEYGRLANGIGGRIANPTNTIEFISKTEVPQDRFKDVTYVKFVCNERP